MNINHLIMTGNLTRDPEMRTVGADKAVTHFTIAHNSRYKTSDGEQREEVTFIDCEAWGRQGEIAAQYLTKGTMVIVEGRIKQDNWTDKEGQKRNKLKLVAERVHLTPRGSREDGTSEAGSADASESPHATEAPARGSAPRPPTRLGVPAAPAGRPVARSAPANAEFAEQPPF